MRSSHAVFLLLYVCCYCGLELASCTVGTRVLDVLFVHTYCTQENLDSQPVFHDVNATIQTLNSTWRDADGSDWLLHFSEGDKQLQPLDVILNYLLRSDDHSRDFLAIITPGCSQDTQYIAELSDSTIFNSTLLSYAFSELDTARMFRPSHFRLIPSELHLASGIAAVITEYHWERMVLITQPLPVFQSISKGASDLLNITIEKIELSEDFTFPKDYRIFVLNMYPRQAATILCQAYLQRMLFPDYVWITYGWYSMGWWKDSSCTESQMVSVLVGSIAVSHYPDTGRNSTGLSVYSRLASDAVLAVVNSLSDAHGQVSTDSIKATQFTGFSGPVAFENDTNSRVLDQVSILQYNGSTGLSSDEALLIDLVQIGYVQISNPNHTFKYINDMSAETVWNGDIPADGTPVTVFNYPLLPLMAVCYTAASAGILFAVLCFLFNIIFRNRKLIRLTSPTINYIIIVGTIIFYSSVFTFFYLPGTPTSTVVIVCNFRFWLTSIGFSLCYVPINVKMWRVYHISRKPSLKKTVIKDWHLMLCILLFLVIDIVMLGAVTSITGSRYSTKEIPDKEHPETFIDKDGFTSSYAVLRCHSVTEFYWLPVVFGYKFLLQAIGVYLAIRIRKVKIKGLNDSQEVSIILYVTSAILVVVVLVTFIFGDYINVDGGVYGLGISTATTVVLALLFLPKMYGLYKDPNGENIFITKSAINSGTMKSQLGNPEAIVCSCKVNATSPWNNIDPSGCNFASIEEPKESEPATVQECLTSNVEAKEETCA